MAFQRTRINKKTGKSYTYWEERYRGEDGKVKSRHLGKSLLLRVLDAVFQPIPEEEKGLAYIERLIEKYPGDPFETKAAEINAAKANLSKELGVNLSAPPATAPVEKAPAETPTPASDTPGASSTDGAAPQGEGPAKC